MKRTSENKNEIVVYQADNHTSVEVKLGDDTVWLNRNQIATLFNRDVKTIGKHINNVFAEAELDRGATVANFATVQIEGDREVARQIEHYNLDVIISVGYRVKSKQGTQFRIWANKIIKDYLLKGYAVNKNEVTDYRSLTYKQRQTVMEHPFGIMKRQWNFFNQELSFLKVSSNQLALVVNFSELKLNYICK